MTKRCTTHWLESQKRHQKIEQIFGRKNPISGKQWNLRQRNTQTSTRKEITIEINANSFRADSKWINAEDIRFLDDAKLLMPLQKVLIFRQMPQPSANSSPVAGCCTRSGQPSPSSCTAFGPAGHRGSSARGRLTNRWKSSWQPAQKCVVPKLKTSTISTNEIARTTCRLKFPPQSTSFNSIVILCLSSYLGIVTA